MGKNRLADCGGMDGIAAANSRGHTHTAGRFDLVQIQNLTRIERAQMDRFVSFFQKSLEIGACAIANIETVHGDRSQLEEPQSQSISARFRIPFYDTVSFQYRKEAVRCTFVEFHLFC